MIIVSQDKSIMLNFDNTEAVAILNPLENNEGMFKVCAITPSDNEYTLGKYKTEERAKEVLQEILKSYRHYRTAECDGYTNVLEETAVFEIPKE